MEDATRAYQIKIGQPFMTKDFNETLEIVLLLDKPKPSLKVITMVPAVRRWLKMIYRLGWACAARSRST